MPDSLSPEISTKRKHGRLRHTLGSIKIGNQTVPEANGSFLFLRHGGRRHRSLSLLHRATLDTRPSVPQSHQHCHPHQGKQGKTMLILGLQNPLDSMNALMAGVIHFTSGF